MKTHPTPLKKILQILLLLNIPFLLAYNFDPKNQVLHETSDQVESEEIGESYSFPSQVFIKKRQDDEIIDEDESSRSGRNRRYPQHLDPNAFFSFWLRPGDCPVSSDGARQHFCPSPTANGKWICIDDYQLCDGTQNCPNAEDESRHYCLFYNVLKSEVDLLTKSITTLGPLIPTLEDPSDSKKYKSSGRKSHWNFNQ